MSAVFGPIRELDSKTHFNESTLRLDLRKSGCRICPLNFENDCSGYVWQCGNSACRTSCHLECLFDRLLARNITCPGLCKTPITMEDRDRIIAIQVKILRAENAELRKMIASKDSEFNKMIAAKDAEFNKMIAAKDAEFGRVIANFKESIAELERKLAEKDKIIAAYGLMDVKALSEQFEKYKADASIRDAYIKSVLDKLMSDKKL